AMAANSCCTMRKYWQRSVMNPLGSCSAKMLWPPAVRLRKDSMRFWLDVRCRKRRPGALLHALAPNLPILVAADPAESFDVDALVSAGVSEVVSRPIIADEVAAVLARCLQTTASSDRMAFAADGDTIGTKHVSGALQ